MPPTRGRHSVLTERACYECQKRKTRCVIQDAGRPCEFCTKADRPCVFPTPPSRIPLTRNNLEDALSRCQALETLLEQSRAPSTIPSGVPRLEPGGALTGSQEESGRIVASAVSVEAPRNRNTRDGSCEWDESFVALGSATAQEHAPDGMVSLGPSSARAGYVGTTSGRAMLETISSTLSPSASTNLQASQHSRRSTSPPHGPATYPVARTLTTSSLHDQLISAYFVYYNTSYPVLHEATFRTQYVRRHQLAWDDSWQMLYFMVLALGEWVGGFSNDPQSVYFAAAKSRFRLESLGKGNLSNVQALLLMSNYLQKKDRPNTGFNVLGIAHRMALGLGLHREPVSTSSTDTLSRFTRRTVFWILYCFDSGFSISTGRPIFTDDSFIDVAIPHNLDAALCQSPQDQPKEVSYPTSVSCIIAQARLAKIANKTYTQISSVSPRGDTDHETFIMERMLDTWRASLPSYFLSHEVPPWFSRSRKVVLWKEANIRILLLIASQRQRTDVHEKITIGQRYQSVAVDTLNDICSFFRDSQVDAGPNLTWYAVYFMLQAALALSVHELAKNNVASLPIQQQRSQTYDDLIDQVRHTLGEFWQRDEKSAKALHSLVHLQKGVAASRAGESLPLPPNVATQGDLAECSIRKPRELLNSGDTHMGRARDWSEMLNVSEDFSNGPESFSEPAFSDFLDPSFSMFDNGELLSELFQDCYGPMQGQPSG